MKLHILFIVILFVSSSCISVKSQEVEDESEFSYVSGTETGPEHWGDINKNWSTCNAGHMQSPIDLTNERVKIVDYLGNLHRSYHPRNAVMKNRGHDIMLEWNEDAAGGIWLNGSLYELKQLHWHSPSEHTLNGRRYSLELHMVHQSADKKIAVIGILYKIGRPDSFLTKMEEYIKNMDEDEEEHVGLVDPRDIKRGSRKYYRYIGSLTTPPCTEGVIWTIINKVRTVSKEQINMLREAVHDDYQANARPIQATNKRMVEMFRPENTQH